MRAGRVALFGLGVFLISRVAGASPYTSQVQFALLPNNNNFSPVAFDVVSGQAVGINGNNNTGTNEGVLWTSAGKTSLGPTGEAYGDSEVVATDGQMQVGDVEQIGVGHQALVWSGTASSVVDINPTNLTGFTNAYAHEISGTQVVGYGGGTATVGPDAFHALLWTTVAASSAVDLNPSQLGFTASQAFATNGSQQVGVAAADFGDLDSNGDAILWQSTASSAVNLNPSGFSESIADNIGGGQEVGYGLWKGETDAIVWSGTAASAIDLSPTNLSGYTLSEALATNGSQQVGYGNLDTGTEPEALAWSGTANSAVNLQDLLPAGGTWTDSVAQSIDSSGNIFGYADGTFDGVSGTYAVEWTPVPEPTSLILMAIGSSILMRRRSAV